MNQPEINLILTRRSLVEISSFLAARPRNCRFRRRPSRRKGPARLSSLPVCESGPLPDFKFLGLSTIELYWQHQRPPPGPPSHSHAGRYRPFSLSERGRAFACVFCVFLCLLCRIYTDRHSCAQIHTVSRGRYQFFPYTHV